MGKDKIFVSFGSPFQKLNTDSADATVGRMLKGFFHVTTAEKMLKIKKKISQPFPCAHFQEDLSLKSVARHFGYNEKYLSHTLHSLTGIHFSKLISLYRIEYAQKLLRENFLTVSQIAAESGFSAINTFNRTFKESTGKTPLEYRNASRF